MAYKKLSFRSDAREKVLRGATAIADALRVTLGPKSKSVLIGKRWGRPIVCNDGVTIAKEFEIQDPEENLGAQMLRSAAERTREMVGDGTTTSTILAHTIRRKAMLQDIAVLTGGRVIAEELGVRLESISLADLGRAKRLVADKDNTTIVGGSGSRDAIEGRCRELCHQIEETTSEYDKEKLLRLMTENLLHLSPFRP